MARRRRSKVVKRPAAPAKMERAYAAALLQIVTRCRKPIFAAVERFKKEQERVRVRGDGLHVDAAEAVTRSLSGVKVQLDTIVKRAKPGLLAQGVGKKTTAFASTAIDNAFRGVVEIPGEDVAAGALVKRFVSDNVKLIKSIPAELFGQVEGELVDAWEKGRSTDVLARHIEERFDVSENRARLIARDQIGTLNAKVQEKRARELGAEEYTWSTSHDERVRPEHEERDGETFRYDDPPEDGNPGEPIACRCVAIPTAPDLDDDE